MGDGLIRTILCKMGRHRWGPENALCDYCGAENPRLTEARRRNHDVNECEECVVKNGLGTVERCEPCRREMYSLCDGDSRCGHDD